MPSRPLALLLALLLSGAALAGIGVIEGDTYMFTRLEAPMGPFYIANMQDSDLYLHAYGGAKDGAEATLHPCPKSANHPNCQWVLEPSPTTQGAVYLRSKDSSFYAHALGGAKDGAQITLHACPKSANHPNCQWFITPVDGSNAAFYVRSKGTDLKLHALGGAKDGAKETLHPCRREDNHRNCQWTFTR